MCGLLGKRETRNRSLRPAGIPSAKKDNHGRTSALRGWRGRGRFYQGRRGGRLQPRRRNFFFRRSVRHVGVDVVLVSLLLQCDHVGEIKWRRSGHGLFHELYPDRERSERAGLPLTQGNLFVVVADPDASGELRRKSHKPGVGEILRGTSLAGGGTPKRFGFRGGAELHDFLEHRGHGVCHVGRYHVVDFRMRFLKQSAIVAGDAADHVGVDANAFVRENGERGDVLDQAHVRGAKGQGEIRGQRRGDAEAPGHINDVWYAHFFSEFYSRDVARTGERTAQRDDAFKSIVVIVRRVGLPAADSGKRRVHNRVER